MSLIKKMKQEAFNSLKKLCGDINPERNLSDVIKELLDGDMYNVIEKLDKKEDVSIDDFYSLVSSYFNTLDFCHDNIDDERLQKVRDDISNFITYIDSLNLSSEYNGVLIHDFFERLSAYSFEGSKGIYDLLMIDEIRNSKIMRSFLEDNNLTGISNFAKIFYDFYVNLTEEQQDKVDYIFYSSSESLEYFMECPDEIEIYFNENILNNFNKESLSLLFRSSSYVAYSDFFKADPKFLKMIAAMNEYVLETTDHNSYFLDRVVEVFDSRQYSLKSVYIKLFMEYYDKYFELSKINGFENDELFQNLLSFSLSEDTLGFINDKCIFDLEDFFKAKRDYLTNLYGNAYGKEHILNIKYGLFDLDKDLIEYENNFALRRLKKAFFYRVYGITMEEASHIKSRYGEFLKVCEDKFLDEDKDTLEVLKTICDVYDLSVTSDKDKFKIKELQKRFYLYIKENGLYSINKNASFMMLRSLIDKMYMKAYNKVLYEPKLDNVLYYQRNVPVVDAGLDFNMIVTSINGVGDFFRKNENAKNRYNGSDNSSNQGICASFINNENLGVIALNGPLLAFTNLNDTSLNAMGIGDIYSETNAINLKASNTTLHEGNYFLTPHEYADNTRFGYNEMVLDRFLFKDDDNIIKVQPSYVVCYKIDENYKNTRMYKRSLRFAQEFGIPLVLVDVKKVKEHERDEILSMERELFSSDKVNKELMQEVLTRYMNNYSGSLTIVRTRGRRWNNWNYKRDFSILGMDKFLKKAHRKIEEFENDIDNVYEWYDALKECYLVEKRRNEYAHEVSSYASSLEPGEFVLDDKMEYMDRVNSFTRRTIDRYYMRNNLIDGERISYNPRLEPIPEIDVIVGLSNYLFEHAYVKMEDSSGERIYLTKAVSELSDEDKAAYGIVISYLMGNFNDNYFCNLDSCDYAKMEYNHFMPGTSLMESLMTSEVYSPVINRTPLLVEVASKVNNMDEDEFRNIFKPIIKRIADERDVTEDRVFKKILKRKNTIVEEVSKLPVVDTVKKTENNVKKR
ncbi:MAG: hypothetical protein IJN90_07335 [Bacilli bacterium]|nr:hypothetical protein [Bacilli bacterium]